MVADGEADGEAAGLNGHCDAKMTVTLERQRRPKEVQCCRSGAPLRGFQATHAVST